MIKYVIDDDLSSRKHRIWSDTLIVEKKVLPGFLPSHERDESTVLFRDLKKKEQGRSRHPNFLLSSYKTNMQVTMEPLVYLLVTAIDLGRRRAYRPPSPNHCDVDVACLDAQHSYFWWILEARG